MVVSRGKKRGSLRRRAKDPEVSIRQSGRGPLRLVGVIFLVHALGLALLFDPIKGLFDNQPVIEQDWGLHFHHLKSMEGFWRSDGRLWGYNPFFMAGYPSNTIQDLSVKLFEILSLLALTLGLEAIQAFKLIVFMFTAAIPWIMFFTARNFFCEEELKSIAPLAALLGTAYWWNSLPREMFFYGMVGFPPAIYLSFLILSLLYRVIKSDRRLTPAHAAWVILLAVILPLHFQAVLIVAPLALVLLIIHRSSLNWTVWMWLGIGIGVSFLVNLPWLLPVLSHLGDDASAAIVAQLPIFTSPDPLAFIKDYLRPAGYWTFRASFWENGLRWLLLILGLLGVVRLLRSEQKGVGILMTCGVTMLFLLTYFGSLIPFVKSLQPLRFKVAYDLLLVLTSSYLVAVWESTQRPNSKLMLIRALLICGAIAFLINVTQTESKKKMGLRAQLLPEVEAIVEWIRDSAPPNGRVLFEESGDETGFVYDGMYLSSFIPHWTGHQLIGGPINLYNDRHHFAEFHSRMLFKRDILSLTDGEIFAYFRTYNIGAVIAFHPGSVYRLLAVPGLVALDRRIGAVHMMKVHQPLSWLLKGEGEIAAGLNRLQGSKIKGEEVILKYHWTQGLVSDPPTTIVQERVLDDPIPFIKIINPPLEFTLRVSG